MNNGWVKNSLFCEIFVVEGKMTVEISVDFRSFHSENTTGLSGQELSFGSVLSSSSSEDCSPASWLHKGHFPSVASTYDIRLIPNCTGPGIRCRQRCAVSYSRCGSSWSGYIKASSNESLGTSNRSKHGVGSTLKRLRRQSELKRKPARSKLHRTIGMIVLL
jgi:hypothetical protein